MATSADEMMKALRIKHMSDADIDSLSDAELDSAIALFKRYEGRTKRSLDDVMSSVGDNVRKLPEYDRSKGLGYNVNLWLDKAEADLTANLEGFVSLLDVTESVPALAKMADEAGGYVLGQTLLPFNKLQEEPEGIKALNQIARETIDVAKHPIDNFIERPVTTGLLGAPYLQGLSHIPKVGRALRAASPARAAGKAVTNTVKGGAKVGGVVGTEALSFLTGQDPGALRSLRELSKSSSSRALLKKGLEGGGSDVEAQVSSGIPRSLARMEALTESDIINDVGKMIKEIQGQRSAQVGERFASIRDVVAPIDISDMKQTILAEMQTRFNIYANVKNGKLNKKQPLNFKDSSVAAKGARRRISDLIEDILTRPDQMDANSLQMAKRRMGDYFANNSPEANNIAAMTRDLIDKKLTTAVPGYAEMTAEYNLWSTFLDDFKAAVSMKGAGANQETVLRKVITSLRDPNRVRQELIKEAEQATGINIRAKAAGLEFQEYGAAGLIGRSEAAGAARKAFQGLAISGSFVSGIPWESVLVLPFTSPKLVAQGLINLGWAQEKMQPVMTLVNKMHSIPAIDGMANQGLSIGTVLSTHGFLEEQK